MNKTKGYFLILQPNLQLNWLVEKMFRKNVEPLYGDQTSAIKKILDSKDRICEIFFIADKPEGLIVYKKTLQSEFGLKDSFELKTLLLLDPSKTKGFGRYLLQRAEDVARSYNAEHIYGTISKEMPRVLKYLKKLGWSFLKDETIKRKEVFVVFKKIIYE